jgi:hypothetical protein
VGERPYQGWRVYAFIALARLFHALDLDPVQPDLLDRAEERLEDGLPRISKEEVLHAIRSNTFMTEKVIGYLVDSGFATRQGDARGYDLRITVAGVDHFRRYRRFYLDVYSRELNGHYQYSGTPDWLR